MALFRKTKQELEQALEKLEAAEKRIRDMEADMQALETSMPLLVMSRDGLIERASEPFLELLGYSRENLIGQHHRVLCKSDYVQSEDYIVFWRDLAIGHAKQGYFATLFADGSELELHARYLPVLSEKNVVIRVVVLISPDEFSE